MCWLRKLLAALQADESVMLLIVGGSSVMFNKVEFVHMFEE
jgi:hypothetical protein